MTLQRYHLAGETWEAESPSETPVFLTSQQIYTLTTIGGAIRGFGEWHLPGEMGGAWAHPLRAIHGWGLALETDGQTSPLDDADVCDLYGSHVTRHFAGAPVAVTWSEFAAEVAPALVCAVGFRAGEAPWSGALLIRVEPGLRGPWFGGWPPAAPRIEAGDALRLSAPNAPYAGRAAAVATSAPAAWHVDGGVAIARLPLALAPGEELQLGFALLVAHTSPEDVVEGARRLAGQAAELLAAKAAAYAGLDAAVTLETPDPLLNQGWRIARQNLRMMEASYPDLPPFLLAGIPEYPQLFGCDNTYNAPGALAGGFAQPVRSTLATLAAYAQRACGRVPHEITTNGRVFHPGNTQETPQFAVACRDYLRWTGDLGFIRDVYPLCVEGLDHFQGTLRGGHYPHGDGMVERLGMGTFKLDSVCYLHQALGAIAEMARALGHEEEAAALDARAAALAERFERDWWIEAESLYADSMHLDGRTQLDGHWTIAVPVQTGLASAERARRSLDRIEREWVNEWGLVHTRGAEELVWTLPTGLLALAAFRYQRPGLGVRLLGSIAETARHGTLGTLKELIPIGMCFTQLWSAGLLLQGVAEGLLGITPRAHLHELEIAPVLPEGWPAVSLRGLPLGEHTVDLSATPGALELRHRSGPAPLKVRYRPRADEGWRAATIDPGAGISL